VLPSVRGTNCIRIHRSNQLPFPEELVASLLNNKDKILRYAFIAQAIAALIFLALGYYMGKDHFHLIREGVRTQGRVVGYKQKNFRDTEGNRSYGDTAFMPLVEFQAGGHVVRFQDWKGSSSTGVLGGPVTVLYDPSVPSVAMIDRPVWNWIPWAPTFLAGMFLALVSIKGWFRSLT